MGKWVILLACMCEDVLREQNRALLGEYLDNTETDRERDRERRKTKGWERETNISIKNK